MYYKSYLYSVMDEKRSCVPVDKGWAWVVLAGCVLEITIYGGIMRSFGIFFIQFQLRFNSSTYETAVMGLVQNATLSIFSVFVMTIGLQKFSSRVSVFAGGVFTVAGFLLTAFTADISVFYFGQGFLCGLGMSLIHAPELAIIGAYFNKHKAVANGIFTGGAEIGGLIFAPVIVKLFDKYQYTGAMLIVSGLLMHICVGALLMRPPEFYMQKKTAVESVLEEKRNSNIPCNDIIDAGANTIYKSDKSKEEKAKLYKSLEVVTSEARGSNTSLVIGNTQNEPLLNRVRAHSVGSKIPRRVPKLDSTSRSELHDEPGRLRALMNAISKSQVALFASSEGLYVPAIDYSTSPRKPYSTDDEQNDNGEKKSGYLSSVKSGLASLLSSIFDLHLMRNPLFLCFLLLIFTFMTCHTIVPNFIPTHAKEVGITNENIGIQIAVLAAVSLFARIFVGITVDRKWMNWSTMLALMAFITGTACHLLRFVNNFPAILIFVVVVGFCSGQFHSLHPVILLEVMGPEKFKSSLGFGTLVSGASSAIFFPVTGNLSCNRKTEHFHPTKMMWSR
ncbi:uncharacterized protein LOC123536544 isoform X2 [Mercenaria mercenaria]|uniref:uncharacterized protein LOC123536544 isoform X2 n=1 Tax=Mercenaria mercenaria TaxID=6596 RepID=UPI00234F81CB|nr:uncharacterized protein LOC123536544 isoform X2 [Mercenaria mercenaria]